MENNQPSEWALGLIWKDYRTLFACICPRCSGEECSFCEGFGWIYINETFKNMHIGLAKELDSLKSQADELARALEPFANKEHHVRIIDDPKAVGYDHCLSRNTCKDYPCDYSKAAQALSNYRKGE